MNKLLLVIIFISGQAFASDMGTQATLKVFTKNIQSSYKICKIIALAELRSAEIARQRSIYNCYAKQQTSENCQDDDDSSYFADTTTCIEDEKNKAQSLYYNLSKTLIGNTEAINSLNDLYEYWLTSMDNVYKYSADGKVNILNQRSLIIEDKIDRFNLNQR